MIQNEFIEYIDIKIGMEWDSYEERLKWFYDCDFKF